MFRRILQRTPGRGGSQSSDSDSSATPGNAVDVNNEGSSEGFICPLCMKVCVTPTDLSEHYKSEHTGIEGRQELRDLPAISMQLIESSVFMDALGMLQTVFARNIMSMLYC